MSRPRRHQENVVAHDDGARVRRRVAVAQPRPAHRDLDHGFLNEVLGAVEVTSQQVRGAQQAALRARRPLGELVLHVGPPLNP